MRLTMLGSAAAEAIPALWCECNVCAQARRLQGKDLRRRTSYLIDDDTLVDLGPDANWQVNAFTIDLLKVERIVFTHAHGDHLSPLEFFWRRNGFSRVTRSVKVFGGYRVFTRMAEACACHGLTYNLTDLQVAPTVLSHGKQVEDGDLGILPLGADHDPGASPFVYVFSRGGRKLLICNDTGFLPAPALEAIAGQGVDVAVLDCTLATAHPRCERGHMGVETVLRLRQRLLDAGALKKECRVFANHFSHNGGCLHADLERFFAGEGVGVGYDGLQIEI